VSGAPRSGWHHTRYSRTAPQTKPSAGETRCGVFADLRWIDGTGKACTLLHGEILARSVLLDFLVLQLWLNFFQRAPPSAMRGPAAQGRGFFKSFSAGINACSTRCALMSLLFNRECLLHALSPFSRRLPIPVCRLPATLLWVVRLNFFRLYRMF
jgi:hypothetical protein